MGVTQWLFQRISNVAFVMFGLWLLYFIASPGEFNYNTLQELLNDNASLAYLAITLLLASLNSILAGWQIAGDYAEKFGFNQNLLVAVIAVISIGYLVAGLSILYL